MSSSLLLSKSEQNFVSSGCRDNCRLDGRERDEFRAYTIVTGEAAALSVNDRKKSASKASSALIFSNGSARIMSNTNGSASNNLHCLCSVKADVVQPASQHPRHGVLEFHMDTLTTTTTQLRKQFDELQSILQHLLLTQLVDTAALCLVPHQYVWRLAIDLYLLSPLHETGSFLDAASHVIRAALLDTQLPAVTATQSVVAKDFNPSSSSSSSNNRMDLVVDGDYQKGYAPPGAAHAPCIVTVTLIMTTTTKTAETKQRRSWQQPQTVLLLDATVEEEACAHAQVLVALATTEKATTSETSSSSKSSSNNNNAVTVSGVRLVCRDGGSLPMALLPDCVGLAVRAVQQGRVQRAYYSYHQAASHGAPFLTPVYTVAL